MALKTKKKAQVEEPMVEPTVEPTEETTEEIQDTPQSPLTEEEIDALHKAEEDNKENLADTKRLQLANDVVSKQFNLDLSYHMSKFDDKGKVVKLTLENNEFILDVTIKDSDRHGMYVD